MAQITDQVHIRFINEALKAHNECRAKHGVPALLLVILAISYLYINLS